MEEQKEIPPYRMNQLMKAASKMTDQMVNGVLHLTYPEMEIVLELVRECMNKVTERNRLTEAEQTCREFKEKKER